MATDLRPFHDLPWVYVAALPRVQIRWRRGDASEPEPTSAGSQHEPLDAVDMSVKKAAGLSKHCTAVRHMHVRCAKVDKKSG